MIYIIDQKKPSLEMVLEHHGVKGMHWGVRKEASTSVGPTITSNGIIARQDGSIDIAKGASLQRLVRSNGKSAPLKDITYASLNSYDNARYIKVIGGKGFFGGGRDQILSIKATAPIKAPSVAVATKVNSKLMLNDKEFREKNTNLIGANISEKELKQIRDDPGGKTAQAWYYMTNLRMTFDKDFDPGAIYIQTKMRDEIKKKGFNALRDENDVGSKVAKTPIIIFNPETSLRVVSTTQITDEIRKANKAELKQFKKQGQDFVDSQLYSK